MDSHQKETDVIEGENRQVKEWETPGKNQERKREEAWRVLSLARMEIRHEKMTADSTARRMSEPGEKRGRWRRQPWETSRST